LNPTLTQRELGQLVACPECGGRGWSPSQAGGHGKYGRVNHERYPCPTCWGQRVIYEAEYRLWLVAHASRIN
jgi:predicted RNA-binding Zn-ribbon protein involved in translation (DUF1610 family)